MFKKIVVGTDGSDTAKEAVHQAVDLAKNVGATVNVVCAYRPVDEGRLRRERQEVPEDLKWMINPREDVEALLREVTDEAKESGVSIEGFAREGEPADALIDVAEEEGADLIVVGNRGMTGASRFVLGSVPNKVSHHAPCSVMIVRTS